MIDKELLRLQKEVVISEMKNANIRSKEKQGRKINWDNLLEP